MKADLAQRIIFSILSQLEKPEILKIEPGQIISVLIKEIRGNTAIISFQGKEFTAALEQEVSPGTRLKCLVEGEKQGQLILRVLNRENEGVSPQSLRNLLVDYGLKDSPVNLALLREMIKGEMPLMPSTIRVLSAFASQAGIAEKDAWIPVFMVSRGIPLETEAYRNIRELLQDLNFLRDSIQKFSDKLQLLTGGEKTVTVGEKTVTGGERTVTGGEKAVTGGERTATVGEKTISGGERTATGGEKSITGGEKAVAGGEKTVTGGEKSITGGERTVVGGEKTVINREKAGRQEIVKLAQNLTARLGDFVITSNENQQVIAFKLQQIFKTLAGGKPNNQNVPAGGAAQEESLAVLLDRFATLLTGAGRSEYGEMAQLARSLAGKMELIQNFNKPDSGSDFIYFINSSIRFEDREEPLRIIINRRNGRKRQADFSSCKIEVTLNTPRLGLVKCEVQVAEKILTLQFYTDNYSSGQFIERAKEDLAERLKSLGFSVGILKTKTLAEKEEDFFEPAEPPLFRIDLKV